MNSPYTIVVRFIGLLLLAFVCLKLWTMWNQKRKVDAMFDEMRVLASEASYYQQFDADEASRTLLRLMGLMWKVELWGVAPENVTERIFRMERRMFDGNRKTPAEPVRQRLIRMNIEANRDALRKLGYPPEQQIFIALDEGKLPRVEEGPFEGRRPVVHRIIDPIHSPGLDMVIANFEIRPELTESPMDDVTLARARQLVRELGNARIIDRDAVERITQDLER